MGWLAEGRVKGVLVLWGLAGFGILYQRKNEDLRYGGKCSG